MTYTPVPPPPPRSGSGMPSWLKWSLIGCSGCLLVAIVLAFVGGYAFWQFIGKNLNWQMVDVSGKPDMPLTATAGQLLPPRVGAFVRKSVGQPSRQSGATTSSGWQGSYVAGAKRVTLFVMPTAAAQRGGRLPGGAPRQTGNPNMGIHMSVKVGNTPMDMVSWSKTNWTFVIQSQDMVAMQFFQAYRPGGGGGAGLPAGKGK